MIPTDETTYPTLCAFVESERVGGDGCVCPVCHAHNRVKRYKLVSGHFAILRRLAAAGVGVEVHCRDFAPDGQAYNKMLNVLRHYGFIRQFSENPNNPLNRSGMWAITEMGFRFIGGFTRVPLSFWGIHDVAIWWSVEMSSAPEMEANARRRGLSDMVADMLRASMVDEPNELGTFRVEYVNREECDEGD